MSRLVIASNRVSVPVTGKRKVGGLASALSAALRERGGLWFGWNGEVTPESQAVPHMRRSNGVTYATLALSQADFDAYYNGFANQTIWPLFHYRLNLAAIQRVYREGYFRVNALFAQHLYALLQPDDTIWVHDYHLIPLGLELRALGAKQRLGYFLHIPWPAAEVLYVLPGHRELVRALFSYDLVGFQTPGDVRSFTDYVINEGGGEIMPDGRLKCFGRIIDIDAFPVGCDADGFAARAESEEGRAHTARMKESIAGRDMILGVDRLDYSKGIDRRFQAFSILLERHADLRRKVFMLQIAPGSRGEVPEYQEIKRQLETMSGQINGRFAHYDWVPLRYVNRPYSSTALASIYRASRVALVTPLRDGMNLVAKEFVACQDESDPGVLILSRFAGAAYQMRSAIIVNPFDEEQVADALHQALLMPLGERIERWKSLLEGVREENVHVWLDSFLERLIPNPLEGQEDETQEAQLDSELDLSVSRKEHRAGNTQHLSGTAFS